MRAKAIPLFILAIIILPVLGEELPSPTRVNQALKGELALAQNHSSYFIIDLRNKNIVLKAKGLVLREWNIETVRSWGKIPPLMALTLGKKSALFAPKRAKIKPGGNEVGDTFELDALELKDMPSSFVLSMSEGISISVRPRPDNFLSRMGSLGRFFRWYLWVPLKNLWLELKKKPFAALDIKLESREEAKALYWALGEGFKGLIFP